MAFPTSPSNNQVHKESGSNRTYVYDSTLGVWDQVKEAQSDISNIAGHISNEVTGFTGIKNCDTWRIHTNFYATTSLQVVNVNWEHGDTYGVGHIGQGMSERNGIFTFPSTGIWSIRWYMTCNGNGGARTWIQSMIMVSTDDESNWNYGAFAFGQAFENGAYASGAAEFIFKLSNVTSHKIRFNIYGSGDARLLGASSVNNTHAVFTRIGDLP